MTQGARNVAPRPRAYSPEGLEALAAQKQDKQLQISVVLPALNEAETIGVICEVIRARLMGAGGLVDELIVVDSGSTDETVASASAAGASAHLAEELTAAGVVRGKGDCLWRSLSVVSGDIVVWLDADTRNFTERFVVDLIAPLLHRDELVMTKAFYERPFVSDDQILPTGGARVTELVARPLLQLLYPELRGVLQPLSGEYAGRTQAFRSIPFFTGYGVEVGLLIDIAERFGVDSIEQVDLGTRVHRNRGVFELGEASFQIMTALFRRLDELGRIKIPEELPKELLQFLPTSEGVRPITHSLEVIERPPIETISRDS